MTPQPDALERLLHDVLPDGKGLVAVIKVYFDESGTHDGSPIMCLSGYLFKERHLKPFRRQWKASLPAGVAVFHMKEAAHQRKRFEGVSRAARDQMLKELVGHVNRYKTYGITVALHPAEFYQTAPKGWVEAYGQVYTTCVRYALKHVAKWCDDHSYYGPVAYFFEAGAEHQEETNRLLNAFYGDPDHRNEYRMKSFAFIGKESSPVLQAADLFAWEFCKMERDTVIEKKQRVRKSMLALTCQPGTHILEFLTGESLRRLFDQNPLPEMV